LAAIPRLVAGLGKADRMNWPQPHDPELARLLEAENPGFRTVLADLQEQAAAVAVEATTLRLLHPNCGKFPDHPSSSPRLANICNVCHRHRRNLSSYLSQRGGRKRMMGDGTRKKTQEHCGFGGRLRMRGDGGEQVCGGPPIRQ